MPEQHTFLDIPTAGEYLVPEGAAVQECRSCGASIIWGQTHTGAAVPLDTAHIRIIDGNRYALTHFATCPHGREWRKHRG